MGVVVLWTAVAATSSRSCRTLMPASSAAFMSPARWASSNQLGVVMTAPSTFFPKKSSADWRRDLRKIVATSDTVRIRSWRLGSDRGVPILEAAGVFALDAAADVGRGLGAGCRICTL